MKIFIIGCGGVGSWLCASVCKLREPAEVVAIDGDTLELKNLDRQLFTEHHIGANKADALAELYKCASFPGWYNAGIIRHAPDDVLFGVVDNNAARLSVLQACDRFNCRAIFAANETTSAESYIYLPQWKGTRLDPRVMYPEILTDHANDPQRAAIGCTGEAQRANRQLVSANFMAAALAQHLFIMWVEKFSGPEVIPFLPHKLTANKTNLEISQVGNLNPI